MPRKIVTLIYKYNELSDDAKRTARDWWRGGIGDDPSWYEPVYEDARECLKLCGFRVDRIYFIGFSSQGDGAMFEGAWKAAWINKPGALKAHAPKDTTLHQIADTLEDIAVKFPGATLSVKHRGRYYHEHETEFTVNADEEGNELPGPVQVRLISTVKDAMKWIYKRLEEEWDYINEDAQVEEAIIANEYEFYADGSRHVEKRKVQK